MNNLQRLCEAEHKIKNEVKSILINTNTASFDYIHNDLISVNLRIIDEIAGAEEVNNIKRRYGLEWLLGYEVEEF
jgi:hypothetical protein